MHQHHYKNNASVSPLMGDSERRHERHGCLLINSKEKTISRLILTPQRPRRMAYLERKKMSEEVRQPKI
jgi:hypothetical protein